MKSEQLSVQIDSIKSIDHLGIVAGTYHKLGLAQIIDRALPKTGQHHLSSSQILLALFSKDLDLPKDGSIFFPIIVNTLTLNVW